MSYLSTTRCQVPRCDGSVVEAEPSDKKLASSVSDCNSQGSRTSLEDYIVRLNEYTLYTITSMRSLFCDITRVLDGRLVLLKY
jgi:hypothetical protein